MDRFEQVAVRISDFAREREWEQFHTPKNLMMALSGEVGELIAEFQWLTSAESFLDQADPRYKAVCEEIADVFIYTLRLAEILQIDLLDVAERKIETNAVRYPVALARGRAERPAAPPA